MTTVRLMIAVLVFATAAGAVEVIDPTEVAPGATGVCVTEMDGGEMVEIPVTVLGTVGPWTPEGEMVLVRLEDERFRHTGVIAGMSGSPVYVGDRLLGALAFGWSFSKDPIAGVTPFSRMSGLATADDSSATTRPGRPALAEILDAADRDELGSVLTEWLLPESSRDVASLPLAVSGTGGAGPSAGGWLAEGWRRLGWVSVPAGSSGDAEMAPVRPGAMVAAVLVDGDAVLAAGGTVTEVRGDEIWAFGHPFLGGGDSRIPMASARVVTVLPSQASSFKFFTVGNSIGTFVVDRSHGIWGRLGDAPPMIPVAVTIDGRRYDFRSVRHATLTPFLVAQVVQSSHAARGRTFGDQTVALRVELSYEGRQPVTYRETLAAGDAPARVSALAAAVVAFLENSSYQVPQLESIAVSVETREQIGAMRIIDVVPHRRIVGPGERLPVRVRLRPYRGEEIAEELLIDIPVGLDEGRLDLVVADGAAWSLYDLGMRPLTPGSFDDEIRLINALRPSTSLVAALEVGRVGVALEGGSLSMPPGLVAQLRGGLGPEIRTTSYAVVGLVEESMTAPVSGAVRIELQVRSEEPLGRSEAQ